MIGYLSQAEWVRRFGHYWWVYPATLASSLIPIEGWQRWILIVPVMTIGVFSILVAQDAHKEKFCPQCVAGWPTNPSEVAEQVWRWLWWYHFGGYVTIATAVVWVAALFVFPLPAATSTLLLVGIYFSQGKSRRLHNDLKPWCRWCRRRGDDDDNHVAPTPTPSETRS